MDSKKKIFVGMSGGVDSSVAAALLKEQGRDVTGVYMKNWTKDIPGFPCPWKEDFQDAKRVAVQLGIELKVYDFETEYKQKVVDYMIEEYQAGLTPNPDIMCNQEIKFKLFLETALADGADMIATGHYARILNVQDVKGPSFHKLSTKTEITESSYNSVQGRTFHAGLFVARNQDKDQTYFLYRVSETALQKTLFPIGEFKTKQEVRDLAKKFGLATADKKDSQGICFVGKVGIKDFLRQYVTAQPGAIVDSQGQTIGEHEGAIFYTIGQRHGLNVGGGLPYYVTGKDMDKNEVYLTNNLDDDNLWHKTLNLSDVHWINAQAAAAGKKYTVRTRYRAPLVACTLDIAPRTSRIELEDAVRAVTPGQSAVIYDGGQVLGGGIVV